jgi:hypothetical protein
MQHQSNNNEQCDMRTRTHLCHELVAHTCHGDRFARNLTVLRSQELHLVFVIPKHWISAFAKVGVGAFALKTQAEIGRAHV